MRNTSVITSCSLTSNATMSSASLSDAACAATATSARASGEAVTEQAFGRVRGASSLSRLEVRPQDDDYVDHGLALVRDLDIGQRQPERLGGGLALQPRCRAGVVDEDVRGGVTEPAGVAPVDVRQPGRHQPGARL